MSDDGSPGDRVVLGRDVLDRGGRTDGADHGDVLMDRAITTEGIPALRAVFDEQMVLSLEEAYGNSDGWQWSLILAYHTQAVYAYLRDLSDSSCVVVKLDDEDLAEPSWPTLVADALVNIQKGNGEQA